MRLIVNICERGVSTYFNAEKCIYTYFRSVEGRFKICVSVSSTDIVRLVNVIGGALMAGRREYLYSLSKSGCRIDGKGVN